MQSAQLAKIQAWLEDIEAKSRSITIRHGTSPPVYMETGRRIGGGDWSHPDETESLAWAVEAEAALASIFHPGHPVLVRWNDARDAKSVKNVNSVLDKLRGVFIGALQTVKSGYLGDVRESIRAETVAELLDLADDLNREGRQAAAAVLAGGALETHLRHLADSYEVAIEGHSTIGKIDQAIAKARKEGAGAYSVTDSKHVTVWAGQRNEAAHEPLKFEKNNDEAAVRLMVEGIRQFLAKTT